MKDLNQIYTSIAILCFIIVVTVTFIIPKIRRHRYRIVTYRVSPECEVHVAQYYYRRVWMNIVRKENGAIGLSVCSTGDQHLSIIDAYTSLCDFDKTSYWKIKDLVLSDNITSSRSCQVKDFLYVNREWIGDLND